jgi:hypothetical protein
VIAAARLTHLRRLDRKKGFAVRIAFRVCDKRLRLLDDAVIGHAGSYHFSNFIVSPRRWLLVRDGRELSLIPRYFDLLVFLIERRR